MDKYEAYRVLNNLDSDIDSDRDLERYSVLD